MGSLTTDCRKSTESYHRKVLSWKPLRLLVMHIKHLSKFWCKPFALKPFPHYSCILSFLSFVSINVCSAYCSPRWRPFLLAVRSKLALLKASQIHRLPVIKIKLRKIFPNYSTSARHLVCWQWVKNPKIISNSYSKIPWVKSYEYYLSKSTEPGLMISCLYLEIQNIDPE